MEQAIGRGLDVFDLDGEKIGTVDRIFRERERESLLSEPIGGEARFGSGYLEVGARVPGLGRTLFIPFSEIADVDERGVHVRVHKDAVENREWDLRPAFLDDERWAEERS